MRSQRGRVCAVTRQCHCWHSLSRAKTRGGTKEGKYSPLTKTLPLRRSNTDCRAGMNREASAAVSADLNRNTFSSPRLSGVDERRIALLSRAELLSANHSGGEVKRCSPLGVMEIKSPSYCVGGNKCSLYRAQPHFKASHSWSVFGVLCCFAICCQNSVSEC